jgi:hypothetical protein
VLLPVFFQHHPVVNEYFNKLWVKCQALFKKKEDKKEIKEQKDDKKDSLVVEDFNLKLSKKQNLQEKSSKKSPHHLAK